MENTSSTQKTFNIQPKYLSKVKAICKFLADNEKWKERANELYNQKEYGYALLNLWNMIEATLKLLWYIEHPDDFSDNLDKDKFNDEWDFLKNIAQSNHKELNKILDISIQPKKPGGQPKYLRNLRNDIVHFNYIPKKKTKVDEYKNAANSILQLLSKELASKSEYSEILETIKKIEKIQ